MQQYYAFYEHTLVSRAQLKTIHGRTALFPSSWDDPTSPSRDEAANLLPIFDEADGANALHDDANASRVTTAENFIMVVLIFGDVVVPLRRSISSTKIDLQGHIIFILLDNYIYNVCFYRILIYIVEP